MIIEFFGISGVGKTTLSKQIFDEKTKEDKKILWPRFHLYEENSWLKRNIKKCGGVIAAILSNPGMLRELRCLFSRLHIRRKDRIILTYNYFSAKYLLSKCSDLSVDYLFDEGVFQLIWATFLRTDMVVEPIYIKKICSFFPVPDKLIVVNAETDVIIARLQKRGRKTKILEFTDLREKINAMKEKQTAIIESCLQLRLITPGQIEYWDNN